MTDTSMAEQPVEDDDFDKMLFPVEQKQLESLQQVVSALVQVYQGLQVIAHQNAQIAQLLSADRESTMTGRDGRELKSVSRIKG